MRSPSASETASCTVFTGHTPEMSTGSKRESLPSASARGRSTICSPCAAWAAFWISSRQPSIHTL